MVDTYLTCDFCWHMCRIPLGGVGLCHVRANREGKLVTLGWGEVLASSIDPIEKKPLYHVLPGVKTYSIALFGCNYSCKFCQNHQLSQIDSPLWPGHPEYRVKSIVTPEEVVKDFERSGCPIMSYTYSEPIVWQDYMLAVAQQVRKLGKINCMVTNGSFSEKSLERLLDVIDVFNIDIKGDELFYRQYCSASLVPVLRGIQEIAQRSDKVLEVTTMIIEGIHTKSMIRSLAQSLVDAKVHVWHLSRFFPHYQMRDRAPTSERFLESMLLIAEEAGIPYVYAGNSSLGSWERTVCPHCKTTLIHTHSYSGEATKEAKRTIIDGRCANCGEPIYGLFTR
jgi:pyruvate formate lyase activating enzyme